MSVTSSEHQNLYLPTDFDKIWYVCTRSTKKNFDKNMTSSKHQKSCLPIDLDEILYGCSWVTQIDKNASEHGNNGGGVRCMQTAQCLRRLHASWISIP